MGRSPNAAHDPVAWCCICCWYENNKKDVMSSDNKYTKKLTVNGGNREK